MKKIFLFAAIAIAVAGFVSFTGYKKHTRHILTESISGYVYNWYGANDVEVIFDRTGPDAGQGCVSFDVDIWFNSDGNIQTFHFNMSDGETHLDTHIQAPVSILIDAAVHGDPYNPDYINCY